MKPKSGNRRDRSRSKTITTASSDDKLASFPYTSDIEHLVETSPQKPEKADNHSDTLKLELDEGYAEASNTTPGEVDRPQEVKLSNPGRLSYKADKLMHRMLSQVQSEHTCVLTVLWWPRGGRRRRRCGSYWKTTRRQMLQTTEHLPHNQAAMRLLAHHHSKQQRRLNHSRYPLLCLLEVKNFQTCHHTRLSLLT